jgi:hypothetical protein
MAVSVMQFSFSEIYPLVQVEVAKREAKRAKRTKRAKSSFCPFCLSCLFCFPPALLAEVEIYLFIQSA